MKIVIYVRVSTQEQALEGYSISAQINILKAYAESLGYTIVFIYEDQGISGKNIKDRPGLLKLIEDAKQKKFDSVLVWKLSRLSRSLLDLLSIVDIFTLHNISFQSFSEKFDTSTPIGKMLLHMLGSIAEFERNTIIENVKLGLNERFKQGYSKGAIPFGYRSENKKAVVVPEQAEIVKFAFEHYLKFPNKEGTTYIAEYLNCNGHRTRTRGLWTRVAVRDMLKNIFYAGYVRTGIHAHGYKIKDYAAEIPGQHEPIISMELYNKVKEKLDINKQGVVRNPDNDSFLTGLVKCPFCGDSLFALNTYNKYKTVSGTINKNPIRIYRCTGKDKQKCKGFYVSGKRIEPQAMEMIKQAADGNVLKEIIKTANGYAKEINKPVVDKVKVIEKELKKLESVRDKYYKLFETGKVNIELFADKINGILTQINNLEEQRRTELENKVDIIPVQDSTEMLDNINNFIELFENATNPEKKALARAFIQAVYVNEHKNVYQIDFINGLKINDDLLS